VRKLAAVRSRGKPTRPWSGDFARTVRLPLFALVCAAFVATPPDAAGRRGLVTLLGTTDFHGALVAGGNDRRTGRPWGGATAGGARADG
jgi:hypothetical protein